MSLNPTPKKSKIRIKDQCKSNLRNEPITFHLSETRGRKKIKKIKIRIKDQYISNLQLKNPFHLSQTTKAT